MLPAQVDLHLQLCKRFFLARNRLGQEWAFQGAGPRFKSKTSQPAEPHGERSVGLNGETPEPGSERANRGWGGGGGGELDLPSLPGRGALPEEEGRSVLPGVAFGGERRKKAESVPEASFGKWGCYPTFGRPEVPQPAAKRRGRGPPPPAVPSGLALPKAPLPPVNQPETRPARPARSSGRRRRRGSEVYRGGRAPGRRRDSLRAIAFCPRREGGQRGEEREADLRPVETAPTHQQRVLGSLSAEPSLCAEASVPEKEDLDAPGGKKGQGSRSAPPPFPGPPAPVPSRCAGKTSLSGPRSRRRRKVCLRSQPGARERAAGRSRARRGKQESSLASEAEDEEGGRPRGSHYSPRAARGRPGVKGSPADPDIQFHWYSNAGPSERL
ncbi:collagen alpha-1(I) chain-like [Candoia aspera]|uniref:collagen alpha-1(I) chain-like n=1 Tax=Candoia aspera TaxID=51853 RepID=UPI002FD83432